MGFVACSMGGRHGLHHAVLGDSRFFAVLDGFIAPLIAAGGLQLALAAAFIGPFWLRLRLGAGCFAPIDIDFVERLVARRFAMPASTLAARVIRRRAIPWGRAG